MPSITLQSRVQRRPDILSAEINAETALMSAELGEYYGLNTVASDIWRRLAQPVTVARLVQDLAESYEGDPAVIETDVQSVLAGLAEKGLLIVDPVTGG